LNFDSKIYNQEFSFFDFKHYKSRFLMLDRNGVCLLPQEWGSSPRSGVKGLKIFDLITPFREKPLSSRAKARATFPIFWGKRIAHKM
jgi:hypothetical protein